MTMIQAVILGILQGLAEFLPISSSGHLALFQKIFGITESTILFSVILHVGTLVPVLIVYRKEIITLLKNPFQKYTYLIILGTVPAVIFALFFDNTIEILFSGGQLLGVGFIITGFLLTLSDKLPDGSKTKEDMTYIDSILIGCMQALAIFPAISRSGSTIVGALSRNITREEAAKFSFLLSIPAIGGALVLEILKLYLQKDFSIGLPLDVVLVGFFSSMLSGYLAINFMLYIIKKAKLKYFAYYVFTLGIFIILDQILFNIYF